jgi:hypothetical protein
MLQKLADKTKDASAVPLKPYHAQGEYLFQSTCVNLESRRNIAGDWIKVASGGVAGPGGEQLDKISGGYCSALFGLQRKLHARTVHTQGGGRAHWDGDVLGM